MRIIRVAFLISLLALVVVPSALALRFTDESFMTPVGITGQPYQHKFEGAAGCGPDPNVPGSGLPYQFRILSGTLPPGLSLAKNGLVSGTPTQAGEWSFWVELSDEDPPSASWCVPKKAERQFTIKINAGLNIQQNSLSPKTTFLSEPYSFQLTAAGASAPTWSIQSGSLPPGINLASSGLLSGTPTSAGDYTFGVKVTDGGRSDTETFSLTVVARLKIAPPTSTGAEVGFPFTLGLKATGGRPATTWSISSGTLPSGLTLDSGSGLISGTPTSAGSFPLKLTVTDRLGLQDTVDITLAVAAKLTITKRALKVAKVGTAYRDRFAASGGVLPRKWILLGGRPGSLPPGMKLNAKTGQLSGTPTKAGTYRLRMQVVDKLGVKSSAAFVLKVNA